MAVQFLSIRTVCSALRRCRGSVYNDIAAGVLPPGLKVGQRSVAWPEYEIQAVQTARAAGLTESQVREVVASILDARARGVGETEVPLIVPRMLNAPTRRKSTAGHAQIGA